MAFQVLFCAAFFLLVSRIYADSCVSKPCGSDYRVTSWNPVREGSDEVYYYQVQTVDECDGAVFTDVLLQTSLSCQNCANVYCYDSYWRRVRCNYPPQWVTSDSFLNSKGVSTTSGLKWTLPRSNVLRFSVNVNPFTTTNAQGRIYTKGNSWASCPVVTPVCKCGCSPCPSSCYRPSYQTNCTCNNCTPCYSGSYQIGACNSTSNAVCANCTQCVTNMTYESVPCSGTKNRQCSNCTQCVNGTTYESRACNVTQNRVCTTCTQCVTNMTFETVPCTSGHNRQCKNCTVCVAGKQFQTAPCGAKTDRNCTNCTICENGFFEMAPCNSTSDRTCQRCSNCSSDEQVLSPCNATHDIVCVPCPNCANCSAIPHSHLSNNGLNCSCDPGFTENTNTTGTFCDPTPCCADCQECGFNASISCFNHDPDMCNYTCDLNASCTLGTTPSQTGYTITYNGLTIDAACCGATGGDCSCFSYQLSSSTFLLNDFVLGLNCRELSQCDGLSPGPCLQTILRDGVDGLVIFGIPGSRNPFTGVTGVAITGLDLFQDTTTLTFLFQGHFNESQIPITFSAGAQPDPLSEDRTCLVSSITGPDCVSCPSP